MTQMLVSFIAVAPSAIAIVAFFEILLQEQHDFHIADEGGALGISIHKLHDNYQLAGL